jgi:hypothetical protein
LGGAAITDTTNSVRIAAFVAVFPDSSADRIQQPSGHSLVVIETGRWTLITDLGGEQW